VLPDFAAVRVLFGSSLRDAGGCLRLCGRGRDLAARFDAPRTVLAADVATMLTDLAEKGAVRL
jgi:hypothetical protein